MKLNYKMIPLSFFVDLIIDISLFKNYYLKIT